MNKQILDLTLLNKPKTCVYCETKEEARMFLNASGFTKRFCEKEAIYTLVSIHGGSGFGFTVGARHWWKDNGFKIYNFNDLLVDSPKRGEETMRKTTYKIKKPITGQAIIEARACKTQLNKALKVIGYSDKVIWDKAFEDICLVGDGWISWLLKEGFIEKRDTLDYSKPIIAQDPDGDKYLLIPQIKKGCYEIAGYNWLNLNKHSYNSNVFFASPEEALRCYRHYKIRNVDLTGI